MKLSEIKEEKAEYIKHIAVKEGVPAGDIIPEVQATTTRENMTYALSIFENTPGLLRDNKFILVTSEYHMYRSLLLAKKVFGNVRIIPCPAREPDLCPETWRDSDRGRRIKKNEVHFLYVKTPFREPVHGLLKGVFH